MQNKTRIFAAIIMIITIFDALLTAGCTTGGMAAITNTSEPTALLTPYATPTLEPTPSPEPTPEPLTISFDQKLTGVENADISVHKVEYIKNQSISFVLTVDNHEETLYLDFPCYATINGWGLYFYPKVKRKELVYIDSIGNFSITLIAELDESIDKLLNLSQICDFSFEVHFTRFSSGETLRAISDVYRNQDCPTDYTQLYPQINEDTVVASGDNIDAYLQTGLNSYFYVAEELFNPETQKLYVALYGKPLSIEAISSKPDFGNAYLAIDGVISDPGCRVFLPSGGFTILTFDLAKHPDFDLLSHQHAISFYVSYSPSLWSAGYLAAELSPENVKQSYQPGFDKSGVVWASTKEYELIYQGINTVKIRDYEGGVYQLPEMPCLDFIFINNSCTEVLALHLDETLLDGEEIWPRFLDLPVPPMSAGIIHLPIDDWLHKKSLNEGTIELSFSVIKPVKVVDKIHNIIEPSN